MKSNCKDCSAIISSLKAKRCRPCFSKQLKILMKIHGCSGTKIYKTWQRILLYQKKFPKEWLSFKEFQKDFEPVPKKPIPSAIISLRRINSKKAASKENLCWWISLPYKDYNKER